MSEFKFRVSSILTIGRSIEINLIAIIMNYFDQLA
jgi:hypothetical protein